MNDHDIAVIGMSGRFPEADDLASFWENIKNGKGSIRPFPSTRIAELGCFFPEIRSEQFAYAGYLDTISYFDPEYFQLSAEESRYMDPQQRLLLELVEEAVQNAGYTTGKIANQSVGVFLADTKNEYGALVNQRIPMAFINSIEAAIAGRIAYTFNFTGPALTMDTACSSSLVALHYACQSLRNEECAYAVAGGVRLGPIPRSIESLQYSPVSSKSQMIRAFDKDADGTVSGEGGAILVLKLLQKALADGDHIHAVIKGSWINNDGRRSNGLSAPSPVAQADVILQAIKKSQVNPESITYIETHGTGTRLGDPIEIEGITKAFSQVSTKKQWIGIGSVKTNIGHLDGAAGIANVVKVILALKHKQIPPTINFVEPNAHIEFVDSPVYVNTALQEWGSARARRAGVTSLGLIGTNAHMILEEAPPFTNESQSIKKSLNLITLSAQNLTSLQNMVKVLAEYLQKVETITLDNIAYTLNTGRKHCTHRLALLVETPEELLSELDKILYCGIARYSIKKLDPVLKPVIIYGDFFKLQEYAIQELLDHENNFAEAYKDCLKNIKETQEARFFALQYAFTKWLATNGIKPKSVMGIGMGKCVSDVIKLSKTLQEGLELAQVYQQTDVVISEERLNKVVQSMIKDGHNLIICLGEQTGFLAKLGQIFAENDLSVLHWGMNRQSMYECIQKLYQGGYAFDWEQFYQDKHKRRVELPTYVFNRQSYLFDRNVLNLKVQVSDIQQPNANDEREKSSTVIFDDISAIFSTVLPNPLLIDKAFMEVGGDSMAVLQIVQLIKQRYQVTIPMHRFYVTALLHELIEEIVKEINQRLEQVSERENMRNTTTSEVNSSRLRESQAFSLDVEQVSIIQADSLQEVFLTGATGFLGAHLLWELLTRTDATVYCLIRGEEIIDTQAYLERKLQFYFGKRIQSYLKRIVPLAGDLCKDKMGLNEHEYEKLVIRIDTVLHSAADVRHFGSYEWFREINVGGTQKVLDFCQTGTKKRLHHISTLAVGGTHSDVSVYTENDVTVGQDLSGDVYGLSKFEAEKLVLNARQYGLQATIYRVGNLTGRYSDGVFQENIHTNALYNSLKAILKLGILPISALSSKIEFTPVDLCASAIVQLMLLKDASQKTFHICHPKQVVLQHFQKYLNQLGYSLHTIEDRIFHQQIQEQVEHDDFSRELSLLFSMLRGENDLEYSTRSHQTVFATAFSEGVLNKIGFEWPELKTDYFRKLFKYCEEVGYIMR